MTFCKVCSPNLPYQKYYKDLQAAKQTLLRKDKWKILSEWRRWIAPYVDKPQDLKYKTENNATLGTALIMEIFNCQDIENKERSSDLVNIKIGFLERVC